MDDQTIRGSTRITLGDHLRIAWNRRNQWTLVLLIVVLLAINFQQQRASLFGSGATAWNWLLLAIVVTAFTLPWVFLVIGSIVFGHRRMSREQLKVSYRIAPDALVTEDQTGSQISISWSVVRSAREDSCAFRLYLKPSGLRYYPKRAFAESDLPALRAIIRQHLGAKAKLKA